VLTAAAGINVQYPPSEIKHHVYYMLDCETFDIESFFDQAT